jgi:hypothetical protein
MTWTSEELAYMAGIIDGEGTIGARHRSNGKGRRYHDFMMSIASTDARLIDWIHERFGGSRDYRDQRDSVRHKPLYRVSWAGKQGAAIAEACLPYLVIKKEQALLYLELRALMGTRGARVTPENFAMRSDLVDQLHVLNKRGKAVTP